MIYERRREKIIRLANKEGSWVMSPLNIASRSVETVSSHFKISEHLIKELLRQLT